MYYVVFDLKGEPFEVTASKLHDLIVVRRWDFNPPNEKKATFDKADPTLNTKGTSNE